jgi:ATP adenylyltransferase
VEKSSGCFLCDSIAYLSESQSVETYSETLIVAKSEYGFAILNKYPYNAGHVLVCPIKHQADLLDLDDNTLKDLSKLKLLVIKAMKQIYKPHGYNIGLNIGSASGAGLPGHLHYHIIPRWEGDTNFMTSVADTKVISEEIQATHKKYFEQINRIRFEANPS